MGLVVGIVVVVGLRPFGHFDFNLIVIYENLSNFLSERQGGSHNDIQNFDKIRLGSKIYDFKVLSHTLLNKLQLS